MTFSLNLEANETEFQRYILDYIPVQEQYSYVTGLVFKHYRENGYDTWVLSRNYLNNSQYKYLNNIEADTNKIYDYHSGEGEIKARYERTIIGERDSGLVMVQDMNMHITETQLTGDLFRMDLRE